MDKDIIIPIDFNQLYPETMHPLISEEDVVLFALTEGMIVKVKQGNDQWKGIINCDSNLHLCFVVIQEGTYQDLTFPEGLSFTNKEGYKNHIIWLEENLMPNRLWLFNNFIKLAQENYLQVTDVTHSDRLIQNPNSLQQISQIIKSSVLEILNNSANVKPRANIRNTLIDENEILNSYIWFTQATGIEIKEIPKGIYDLMLDVSLYFSKVIKYNNDVDWIFFDDKLWLKGDCIQPDNSFLVPFKFGFVQENVINPFGLVLLYFLDIFYKGEEYEFTLEKLYHWVIRR
ncbi:hypothetical protein [Paenibacillus lemnae]|uniref:Uncharacterized protein n=1 Tax=Paenibacillus lemnae TaxID=1330551 RepID=A0A848M3Y7_PAELE|nr:hypothetical protein [Paenibacillus lemnae]NMO94930.1 hypothetical protein [Paenibacillus lemnae]